MQNPLVSIVIPVFNRPQLLKRALLSVEKQTYTNWECLIVDDGSTDNTCDVAQEFVNKDKRFRLLKITHGGGAKAINDGIPVATGDYITLLGSDDEFEPEHIDIRLNEFEKDPALDFVHGGFVVVGPEMVPDKRDVTKMISLYDPEVKVGGTSFGKKEVFVRLGGFRKMVYASDSDFVERAMAAFTVKRVSYPTYIYYRDHTDSATERFIQKVRDGDMQV